MAKKLGKSNEFLDIERDEDFVHRGEHRSGWEERHESLTDYLMDGKAPRSAEGQIKEVYRLCRNRGDNLSPTGKHQIVFSPTEETGHTDGKKVFVSTKVMDEQKTFSEKADIMMGITTHEMAHVMHTDFDLLKKEIRDRFTHSIWNTIEDERIEHAIGEEFPGYAGNLSKVKDYFFNEKYLLEEALKKGKKLKSGAAATTSPLASPSGDDYDDENEEEETVGGIPKHLIAEDPTEELTEDMDDKEKEATELYDLVFKLIRYPSHIDTDVAAKHETTLDDIKKMLTPYPTTAVEAINVSKKVAKVISDKIEEDMSGPGSGLEDIKEMLSDMMEAGTSSNEDENPIQSDGVHKWDYTEGHVEDLQWKAVFRKGDNTNVKQFQTYLAEVKNDARRLANVLFTKVFSESKKLKGLRSGDLDESKIIEAVHGVKTVHTQTIPKVSKSMSLCLLIDESGSMGSSGKYKDAARVATLIQEAYRIFPIGDLFIYGFTSDDGEDFNTIIRYKEPGIDLKYGLGSIRSRSSNRDGHCIRAAANRIRTFTKRPMIMFIISDGMPAGAYYDGRAAMLDTRKAVTEITKQKFFPIQIGIGSDITPADQKIMYDDFVNYTTSRQMVDEVRKLLITKAHRFAGI